MLQQSITANSVRQIDRHTHTLREEGHVYARPTYSDAQDSNLLVHFTAGSRPQHAEEEVPGGGVQLGGHPSMKHGAGFPPAAMLPLIILCLYLPLKALRHKHPLLQTCKCHELHGQGPI